MTLAEMAPHRSVTVGVLAGQEGVFPDARLHEPPVTYLEDTEAPAYALTNTRRGIGLGTKRNTTAPADGRGTVVLVTGRRTLCLVGQERDDEVIEIPHESVAAVSVHRGLLAHRFELRTPRRGYHCWVPRGTERSLLATAAEFVRDRVGETPEEMETDDGANRLTYRGQPVSPENHPGVSTESSDDATGDDVTTATDGSGEPRSARERTGSEGRAGADAGGGQ
jgi:hypothetical protein